MNICPENIVGNSQQFVEGFLLGQREGRITLIQKILEYYVQFQKPPAATPTQPIILTRVLCASARPLLPWREKGWG